MKNIALYIDLGFLFLVLPVMGVLFPMERWFHNFPWYVLTLAAWLYSLYAVNRLLTVPFLFRGKWWRAAGVAMIVLSVAVTYLISNVTLYTPRPSVRDIGITRVFPYIQGYQQAAWSLFMIVEAFSFAVGLMTQEGRQRARRMEVEAQRDRAEIELYKAQIKPHFMFNTLNSLYGLFLTRNPNALGSLEKFISMTRYMNTTSSRDFTPLADEADYIRQYVELQSLRLSEMTSVSLDISVSDPQLPFPPMLLVTFVENCFKHGVSPVEKSEIRISLREEDSVLLFETSNRAFPRRREASGGVGLDNCARRLDLLYPSRHSLSAGREGDDFYVKLLVQL